MVPATQFTDPIAVETWDAWFRWRAADSLRDVTIDDTWWRVAVALAPVDGSQAPIWAHRYVDAFSRWRLLPDERLLRCAGTSNPPAHRDPPAAVLNVGAFVTAPFGSTPRFDRAGFAETAAIAVRLLDDAILAGRCVGSEGGLRIGVIGFGDALRKLGIAYTGSLAVDEARAVATALAEGCLRGAVDLAEERGACQAGLGDTGLPSRWETLGLPASLIDRARHSGLRHLQLTAIQRHPLLARLANAASDALDPLPVQPHASSETAASLLEAEQRIIAAVQPWIDQPIEPPQGAVATLRPEKEPSVVSATGS